MRWLKYALVAIGGVIAYKVYCKVHQYRKAQADKTPGTHTEQEARARQPGFVSDIADVISGMISGPTQAAPPIASGYGVPYVPNTGESEYLYNDATARIPEFLIGATGGVQDPHVSGDSPPPTIGPVPAGGSGGYYSPSIGTPSKTTGSARSLIASIPQRVHGLFSENWDTKSKNAPTTNMQSSVLH